MIKKLIFILSFLMFPSCANKSEKQIAVKPRILISTDIGGTDPDDNQSMIHFLMYSDLYEAEGLVSSPSYGSGTKQNILEMIDS